MLSERDSYSFAALAPRDALQERVLRTLGNTPWWRNPIRGLLAALCTIVFLGGLGSPWMFIPAPLLIVLFTSTRSLLWCGHEQRWIVTMESDDRLSIAATNGRFFRSEDLSKARKIVFGLTRTQILALRFRELTLQLRIEDCCTPLSDEDAQAFFTWLLRGVKERASTYWSDVSEIQFLQGPLPPRMLLIAPPCLGEDADVTT